MSLRNHTLTVTRTTGEFVDGTWTADAPSVFTIRASVQPSTGKEMLLLPEGRRNREAFTIYTSTEMKTAEPDSPNADKVAINGKTYEVLVSSHWGNSIISHYRVIVSRVEAVELAT